MPRAEVTPRSRPSTSIYASPRKSRTRPEVVITRHAPPVPSDPKTGPTKTIIKPEPNDSTPPPSSPPPNDTTTTPTLSTEQDLHQSDPPDSNLQQPWITPDELEIICPDWEEADFIRNLVHAGFSIPPRRPASDPWCTITLNDGTTAVLPRAYRLPLMFATKFQWESLQLVLTSASRETEWMQFRHDILHVSRLCTEFLRQAKEAMVQSGMERTWRCPMFDRPLTRYYRRWLVTRERYLKKFWMEFGEQEYQEDILKKDWTRFVLKGHKGFRLTKEECEHGLSYKSYTCHMTLGEERIVWSPSTLVPKHVDGTGQGGADTTSNADDKGSQIAERAHMTEDQRPDAEGLREHGDRSRKKRRVKGRRGRNPARSKKKDVPEDKPGFEGPLTLSLPSTMLTTSMQPQPHMSEGPTPIDTTGGSGTRDEGSPPPQSASTPASVQNPNHPISPPLQTPLISSSYIPTPAQDSSENTSLHLVVPPTSSPCIPSSSLKAADPVVSTETTQLLIPGSEHRHSSQGDTLMSQHIAQSPRSEIIEAEKDPHGANSNSGKTPGEQEQADATASAEISSDFTMSDVEDETQSQKDQSTVDAPSCNPQNQSKEDAAADTVTQETSTENPTHVSQQETQVDITPALVAPGVDVEMELVESSISMPQQPLPALDVQLLSTDVTLPSPHVSDLSTNQPTSIQIQFPLPDRPEETEKTHARTTNVPEVSYERQEGSFERHCGDQSWWFESELTDEEELVEGEVDAEGGNSTDEDNEGGSGDDGQGTGGSVEKGKDERGGNFGEERGMEQGETINHTLKKDTLPEQQEENTDEVNPSSPAAFPPAPCLEGTPASNGTSTAEVLEHLVHANPSETNSPSREQPCVSLDQEQNSEGSLIGTLEYPSPPPISATEPKDLTGPHGPSSPRALSIPADCAPHLDNRPQSTPSAPSAQLNSRSPRPSSGGSPSRPTAVESYPPTSSQVEQQDLPIMNASPESARGSPHPPQSNDLGVLPGPALTRQSTAVSSRTTNTTQNFRRSSSLEAGYDVEGPSDAYLGRYTRRVPQDNYFVDHNRQRRHSDRYPYHSNPLPGYSRHHPYPAPVPYASRTTPSSHYHSYDPVTPSYFPASEDDINRYEDLDVVMNDIDEQTTDPMVTKVLDVVKTTLVGLTEILASSSKRSRSSVHRTRRVGRQNLSTNVASGPQSRSPSDFSPEYAASSSTLRPCNSPHDETERTPNSDSAGRLLDEIQTLKHANHEQKAEHRRELTRMRMEMEDLRKQVLQLGHGHPMPQELRRTTSVESDGRAPYPMGTIYSDPPPPPEWHSNLTQANRRYHSTTSPPALTFASHSINELRSDSASFQAPNSPLRGGGSMGTVVSAGERENHPQANPPRVEYPIAPNERDDTPLPIKSQRKHRVLLPMLPPLPTEK